MSVAISRTPDNPAYTDKMIPWWATNYDEISEPYIAQAHRRQFDNSELYGLNDLLSRNYPLERNSYVVSYESTMPDAFMRPK